MIKMMVRMMVKMMIKKVEGSVEECFKEWRLMLASLDQDDDHNNDQGDD